MVSDIFLAAVINTVHTICLARNAFRFHSKLQSIQSAKVRIHSLIAMSGNASTGKCLPSDTTLLDEFSVSTHHHKLKEIILVLWKPPYSPWLKVNNDGSVIGRLAACVSVSFPFSEFFRYLSRCLFLQHWYEFGVSC